MHSIQEARMSVGDMGYRQDARLSAVSGMQGCQHYVVMRSAGDFLLDPHPFITLLVKMAPSSILQMLT